MDLHTKLRVLSVAGASIGVLSLVISQSWKSSVEVEGEIRKRMTPAGWALVAISLAGFGAAIASESVRAKIRSEDSKASSARSDELLTATQPLTALSLHLKFSSADPALRRRMREGERHIRENAESSQGGTPELPFVDVEYDEALLPLVKYIAKVGPIPYDDSINRDDSKIDKSSLVLLIPIDDSHNAILSYSRVSPEVEWYGSLNRPDPPTAPDAGNDMVIEGSMPRAHGRLSESAGGQSIYEIDWRLDPAALARAVHRVNPNVTATARMSKVLRIAIFHDIGTLPFGKYHFARSYYPELWSDAAYTKDEVSVGDAMTDVLLTVTVNGARKPTYSYGLKEVHRKSVTDSYEDELATRCTVLVFERP